MILTVSLWSAAAAVEPWHSTPSPAAITEGEIRDRLLQNCLEYEAAMKLGDRQRVIREQLQIRRNLEDLNELVEQHYLQTPVRVKQDGLS